MQADVRPAFRQIGQWVTQIAPGPTCAQSASIVQGAHPPPAAQNGAPWSSVTQKLSDPFGAFGERVQRAELSRPSA